MLGGLGMASLNFREIVWLAVSVVEVLFLVFLLARRRYRSHPFFSLYILALVLQTVSVALGYRRWGASSREYWEAARRSQAVVVAARWLAIVEIARNVFVRYKGVWRLAGGVLLTLSMVTLTYAVAVSGIASISW
jgi:hypothetical protein